MKTPTLKHDPVFTDWLGDLAFGGTFYAESDECGPRDLLILLNSRRSVWKDGQEMTFILCARLEDGKTMWLSDDTSTRPVEHGAGEVLFDEE